MKRLQKWFEQIAGITQQELEQLARAQKIFSGAAPDISALEKPACWRRQRRVNP